MTFDNPRLLQYYSANKFTIGRYWIPEYGNPDDPEDFKYLFACSPLHNVKSGVAYPTVFVTTADTDALLFKTLNIPSN